MKTLTAPRMERCIGCHSCSLACARLVHKNLSWARAGVRIKSSAGLSTGFEANICLACDPAPCAEACPSGAFSQRKGGGVIVKKKLCIRCGECDKACPVDAIYLDPTGDPFVCITAAGPYPLLADDPEAFAASVVRLLEDPQLRQCLSTNGRRLAEKPYDWQVVLKEMDRVYLEIESERSRSVKIHG